MAESEKKHSHRLLHIIIVILIVVAVLALLKHLIREGKWNSYVVESQKNVLNYKKAESAATGNVIAATIVTVPANSPLIKQGPALETYIQTLANQTKRDIVVVDTSRNILADSVPANVGKKYTSDTQDEISKTLGDGIARNFIEKSIDYPNGIEETVIAIKNPQGATVGAIIISPSSIFGQ